MGFRDMRHGYATLNKIACGKIDVWLLLLWVILVDFAALSLAWSMTQWIIPDMKLSPESGGIILCIVTVWFMPAVGKILAGRPD